MVNKSFNLRLWNVAFHKTRASCSYFSKLIRPLISPMPSMCSNPLNMGYRTVRRRTVRRRTLRRNIPKRVDTSA